MIRVVIGGRKKGFHRKCVRCIGLGPRPTFCGCMERRVGFIPFHTVITQMLCHSSIAAGRMWPLKAVLTAFSLKSSLIFARLSIEILVGLW